MVNLITFSLLFLLAFVVFPISQTPFEIPKVLVAELLIVVLLIARINSKNIIAPKNKGFLLLVLGLGLLSLVGLFTNFTSETLLGNQFRMQGSIIFLILLIFTFISPELDIKKINAKVFSFLLIIQLLAAVFISSDFSRSVGTLGEPNALAAYVVFLWPFCVLGIHGRYTRIWIGIILTIAILIILISGSRSGLFAFLIQLTFFIFNKLQNSIKRSFIFCFILVLLSLGLPFLNNTDQYENRVDVWQTALQAGFKKPLLGWGFGNQGIALNEASLELNNNLRDYNLDSSHNIFLDFWVQGGVVGLLIFFGLIGIAIKSFIQRKKSLEIALFLGLLTVLMFNPVSVVTLIQFWWLIGLSLIPAKLIS